MNVHELAVRPWQGSVPAPSGSRSQNNLDNLKAIIKKIRKDSSIDASIVKKKCLEFTNSIADAQDFFKAAKIFHSVFPVKEVSVKFADGVHKIPHYHLRTLEKDFPHNTDIKDGLKTVTYKEYAEMIESLYSNTEEMKPKRRGKLNDSFSKIGLYNASRFYHSFKEYPKSFSELNVNDLLYFLIADIPLNDEQLTAAITTAKIILDTELDPKKRDDLKIAIELDKAVAKHANRFAESDTYKTFKETKKAIVDTALKEARELTSFEKFKRAFATFLGLSINNWVAVDRAFLQETLKESPCLSIDIPENAPPEFWEWLKSSKNIDSIKLPKKYTIENFESLPPTLSEIDFSKNSRIAMTSYSYQIYDHIRTMPNFKKWTLTDNIEERFTQNYVTFNEELKKIVGSKKENNSGSRT